MQRSQCVNFCCFGLPERIRTSDLRFRKPLLYPTEPISTGTAVVRRSSEASFGNSLDLLRCAVWSSCWMERSMGLEVRILRRCCSASEKTGRPSGMAVSSQSANLSDFSGPAPRYPATRCPSSACAASRDLAFQISRSSLPMRFRIATLYQAPDWLISNVISRRR